MVLIVPEKLFLKIQILSPIENTNFSFDVSQFFKISKFKKKIKLYIIIKIQFSSSMENPSLPLMGAKIFWDIYTWWSFIFFKNPNFDSNSFRPHICKNTNVVKCCHGKIFNIFFCILKKIFFLDHLSKLFLKIQILVLVVTENLFLKI